MTQTNMKNALLTVNWNKLKAEELQQLIRRGARANAYDSDGWTPLMTACNEGAPLGLIKILIQEGRACVNAANPKNGITALMVACRNHSSAVVRYLLAQGADQMACDSWGWSPMMYAIRKQKIQNIKCLRQSSRQYE